MVYNWAKFHLFRALCATYLYYDKAVCCDYYLTRWTLSHASHNNRIIHHFVHNQPQKINLQYVTCAVQSVRIESNLPWWCMERLIATEALRIAREFLIMLNVISLHKENTFVVNGIAVFVRQQCILFLLCFFLLFALLHNFVSFCLIVLHL